MVQFLLNPRSIALAATLLLAAELPARTKATAETRSSPELLMDGGRKLVFERSFHSEREVKTKRSFWNKLTDIVAGEKEYRFLVRPYSTTTDSRGRVIVTDPGAFGVHVFDFEKQRYRFLSRREGKDALESPQCVAVDSLDNIYVTDSEAGKIFVFGPNGKFVRVIGALRGGEGFFKRPTGIAVDSDAQRIYVADTWRHQIFVLDMQGSVLQRIGKAGLADGEFNLPTELRLNGDDLIVVDAMNFRVQVLSRSGVFRRSIGHPGDARGDVFRPKGIAIDSESHLYVADAFLNLVQVFDQDGRLLYYFGKQAGIGDFLLPAGVAIDANDRILVVDSYNRRIQMFRYFGARAPAVVGGAP
ncbi:MAG: 6-bladed beta-propeller [Bryobacteraceae bacterium]